MSHTYARVHTYTHTCVHPQGHTHTTPQNDTHARAYVQTQTHRDTDPHRQHTHTATLTGTYENTGPVRRGHIEDAVCDHPLGVIHSSEGDDRIHR